MFSHESRCRHRASTTSKALFCLEGLAPLAVLVLAAVLRIWSLARPESLVFDELYYVRDAVSQLAHGYPTEWPDDDPTFGGERARLFGEDASTIAHPPLGKWLIGLGVLLFGPDSGWGWRISVALAGVAAVGVAMRLGVLLSRSLWTAWLAGLLLAVDGVHVTLSRVALLDGFLTLFVALGALCVVRDWQSTAVQPRDSGRGVLWRRPWLFAAGLSFGAATAVKWSGLYPLALFLVLLVLGDLLRRLGGARGEDRRPLVGTVLQALATAAMALSAAIGVYLASWIGWIVTPGGQNRLEGIPWWVSLWEWHVDAFAWHLTLSAPHPFESAPIGWPLGLRPTLMYSQRWDGYSATISSLPNPLVTWGGLAALLLLAWVIGRAVWRSASTRHVGPLRSRAVAVSAFVLAGYLSGWLPWVLTFSRSAVFQFYTVAMTPFAALALALGLAAIASAPRTGWLLAGTGFGPLLDFSPRAVQGRRIAVAIFACTALMLGLLFWPLWSAMPVDYWFYQLHLWLPGWS